MTTRIVLAYSGGAASARALSWLVRSANAEVVALIADLGQGGDLAEVRTRALAGGAVRAHVLDARDEFARDFVLPTLKAQALWDGRYPMVAAIARPLLARKLVEVARIESATTVAHACAPRDEARLRHTVVSLDRTLTVIACASADELPAPGFGRPTPDSRLPTPDPIPDRVDRNLWGRIVGSPGLADAWHEVPEAVYADTRPAARWPAQPAVVEIGFARGVPVSVNGITMPLAELFENLSFMAAEHGVGRLDRVKPRPDGSRTRVIVEAPAAVVLHAAHADLQRLVSSDSTASFTRVTSAAYTGLVDAGEWFSPLRRALDAFTDTIQEEVTGRVRVRLFQGHCDVLARAVEPLNP